MTLFCKPIDSKKDIAITEQVSTISTGPFQALRGQIAVVKFGGTALLSPKLKEALVDETISLVRSGLKVVVVHGGGPSVSEALAKQGIPTKKIEGLRVTDSPTIEVVVEVLTKINEELVKEFEAKGGKALAINGDSNNVFLAKKLELKDKAGDFIDLGWVGDIQLVDLFAISRSLESGYIPVIAPIGMDNEGNFYNLNADHAAFAVAATLKADNLLFLTDVAGVLRDMKDPDSRISQISVTEIQEYVRQGIITGGMLPKVKSCVSAIKKGIQQIGIVDGRTRHAVIDGILAPQKAGTLITGVIE